jgi:uncharacterized protein (DUF305 family)
MRASAFIQEIVMACFTTRRFRLNHGVLVAIFLLATSRACAKGDKTTDSAASVAKAAAPTTAMSGDSAAGMQGMSGTSERTFYQDIIKHHQEAIEMVDAYLPTAKNPMVKQMAAKMKAQQTKEIAEFQQRLAMRDASPAASLGARSPAPPPR